VLVLSPVLDPSVVGLVIFELNTFVFLFISFSPPIMRNFACTILSSPARFRALSLVYVTWEDRKHIGIAVPNLALTKDMHFSG
jgi:hypothetical protein